MGRRVGALLVGLGLGIVILGFGSARASVRSAADAGVSARLRAQCAAGLDSLDAALDRLGNADAADARRTAFRDGRRAYKRLEAVLTYFSPPTVEALNSAEAVADLDDPAVGQVVPRGFQRLEGFLFSEDDDHGWPEAGGEIARMRIFLQRFREQLPYVEASDGQLLEMARLELARVSTLGITGIDATLSRDAVPEQAAALDGARALLAVAARPDSATDRALGDAARYLAAHPAFDDFDRFTFVTLYANPAFAAIARQRERLAEPRVALRRTWPREVASIYDVRGLDPQAYAATFAPRPTPEWIDLGRTLFFDPVLSGNGLRACASCHVPERAFTDGRPRALPFAPGDGAVNRHTPSIVLAAWQPAQFADARAATLEDQVDVVLASPSEMRSSTGEAVARLARNGEYRALFASASGEPSERAITARAVRVALAAYVRSLARMDSRFDRAVRGDGALTGSERRGFNLFMGKAGCGTCHFAPLFNGTTPPDFVTAPVEVIGIPRRPVLTGATLDPDSGRAAVDRLDGHLHAFKTPTVRNAAVTAPYMHNGAFATLDAVLDFYERGGGAGIGARVPNQTLAVRRLGLTQEDRRDLVAFLGALVDTAGRSARPPRLPPLAGDTLADRPIGGAY